MKVITVEDSSSEISKIVCSYPLKWTEHIWILGAPEFPSFLVAGENDCAIIEAGVCALVPKILADLDSLNLAPALKYLISAHPHADHVAGLILLKYMRPKLILTGSKETAQVLEKEKIIRNFALEDRMYAKYLADQGLVQNVVSQVLPDGSVKLDRIVNENESIDLGNVHIGMIDAPGHAPGNAIFRIEPDNALLISDSAGYANSAEDILPLFFHHYQNYIVSLEKIKSLDADHIGLGHNVTIDGKDKSKNFLNRAIRKAKTIKQQIAQIGDDPIGTKRFVDDLSKKMLDYGLFKSFSQEVREGFSRLLIRRALESLPDDPTSIRS